MTVAAFDGGFVTVPVFCPSPVLSQSSACRPGTTAAGGVLELERDGESDERGGLQPSSTSPSANRSPCVSPAPSRFVALHVVGCQSVCCSPTGIWSPWVSLATTALLVGRKTAWRSEREPDKVGQFRSAARFTLGVTAWLARRSDANTPRGSREADGG